MVRWLVRGGVLALVVGTLGLIALVVMGVEGESLMETEGGWSPAQSTRTRALLAAHNPRYLRDGEVKTLSVTEDDLGLLASQALRVLGAGGARFRLREGRLDAIASLRLPADRHLNLRLAMRDLTGGLPRFERVRLGRIAVPAVAADWVLARGLAVLYEKAGLHGPSEVVRSVSLREQRMEVTYQWQSKITAAVRSRLVSARDESRIQVYHRRLVEVTAAVSREVSMTKLAAPLFALADERSAEGDPVAENRGAILVLAAYVNGDRLASLVPAARSWPRPRWRRMLLHGRHDLPRHFMGSAAIAVSGGGALSQAIGLFKEIDDSRGGSGFSFVDLLADRVGTRFGSLAVASRASARRIQREAGAGGEESSWMPLPGDLDERLSEGELERRYGGVDSPRYEAVIREIERRIDALPLYR